LRRWPDASGRTSKFAIWSEAPSSTPWTVGSRFSLIAGAATGDVIDLTAFRSRESAADSRLTAARRQRALASPRSASPFGVADFRVHHHRAVARDHFRDDHGRAAFFDAHRRIDRQSELTVCEIRFTSGGTSVVLTKGEAAVSCSQEYGTSFIVSTGGTRVRAVGTEFDVYRKSAATIVSRARGASRSVAAVRRALSDRTSEAAAGRTACPDRRHIACGDARRIGGSNQ